MRIGFLSHFDGNLYQFRLPVMKELKRRGHHIYAIAPQGEFTQKFSLYDIEFVDYKIDRASLNPLKELVTIKNIQNSIEPLNLDILHSFTHKPNIYGGFVGVENFIQTVTGLGSFFIHYDMKSRFIKQIILQGYRITSKRAKKVIFQNSDDLEIFVDLGIVPKEKAVLIKSSGIDTNEWRPMRQKANKKPIVLMIARVIKDKGVLEYIQAAQMLKDKAEFWYVGNIDKGNVNAFNPDWKNVNYLGFRSDIKELITQCDIFVLPSFYGEGVPRTLLEAASMGKPIVTTDNRGCKEVVEDGVNGFLTPIKDYHTLAKKIEILIDNPSLREEFGKNARKKAVQEFDVQRVVEQYMRVYEEVLRADV